MAMPSGAGGRTARLAPSFLSDAVVGLGVLAVAYAAIRLGYEAASSPASVSTDPADLPYLAGRSLLRMFAALALSLVFALVWAYAAARSRRVGRVLIPLLDVLQSLPVLGFLVVAVSGFTTVLPRSEWGLEAAAVFAIFSSQAWNMAFAFYQSLITLPRELDEMARDMGFTRWMRFWKVELPSAAIGLVWNGMLSFAGGWFFLVAAEAATAAGGVHALPGVGSFAGAAVAAGDLGGVGWAVAATAATVVVVNFLFWRPLVAWAERFKVEQAEGATVQRSVVLDLLRRSRWPRLAGRALGLARDMLERAGSHRPGAGRPGECLRRGDGWQQNGHSGDTLINAAVCTSAGAALAVLAVYLARHPAGPALLLEPLLLGAVTLVRVLVLVAVATLVWVPIGVAIGLSPRLTRIAQPIVQVLASFPADLLFPLATWLFLATGAGLDVGGAFLMALGAQWYILFNAIAGATAVPADLREAMDSLGVYGWRRWRRLVIPAVFPAYVTGGITASGGAWNASIVAEVVTFGGTVVTATGLGAYVSQAADAGDHPRLVAGVLVMAFYVMALNRLVWRRLYRLADRRYSLD
ncbi:ABC transporter permease [Sinosporangium siamense]|uniref:Sulfonate ABC transporter permease n=1 Tax=Sinosporangium siamense TaxID=1367973 RepID=A0A919V7M0_9ACTN|nr:ABC transporter permease subunit [Sinosporangium siamense]GII92237.1 sulfonate ABC transporter permease [Sinosporangium siamense]